MGIILDIIIVLIVLFSAVLSARKGFARTFIGLVGYIISIITALFISVYLSNFIFNELVQPGLIEYITDSLQDVGNNVIETIPNFVLNLSSFVGFNKEFLENSVNSDAASSAVLIVDSVKPYILNTIRTFFTICIFALLSFIFRTLAKRINFKISETVFGNANTFLGALLGGAKGLVFSVLFCILVAFIASSGFLGIQTIDKNMIDSSYICSFLLDICSITL